MTRHEIAAGDWIVCQHYPSQRTTGKGPWTAARVLRVFEATLVLSLEGQATTAVRITGKKRVYIERVVARLGLRDSAVEFLERLQAREIGYNVRLSELDAEFAQRRAKLLSDHLGETS